MKGFLITGALTFFLALNVSGQVILRKKDLQTRLDLISNEIEKSNFENALGLFFSKEEVILKDNIPKKYASKYERISTTLTEKKSNFDNTQRVVNDFKILIDNKDFCKSIGLLDLEISEKNSYKSVRDTYTKILPNAKEAKQKCEKNSKETTEWEQFYKNEEFERIYFLLDPSTNDKKYFFSDDLEKLNSLISNLDDKYEIYKSAKDRVLTKPTNTIKNINYNTLTFDQSELRIKELENFSRNSKAEIDKLFGQNPILLSEYTQTKQLLTLEISKLKKFSEANRPLSNSEITQIAFSDKPISLEFIENKCSKADRNIYIIYDLNVFAYYNIRDYDTDLKKEVFKETSEYKEYLSKLKKLKNNLSQTTYYYEAKELFSSVNYDIKKRGFDIKINQNWGTTGTNGAIPPKSVAIDWNNIKLKSLPSKEVTDNLFGSGFTNEMVFIQVDSEFGLEIERNRKDISIYYLFIPSAKENVKFKYYSNSWWDMTNNIITSTKVRVVVSNKKTGKIYYDKIY
jgi:hypothetical protein